MKIEVNSLEYQYWHEVGHAITCLHLGGNVEFIELIEDKNQKGIARARCATTPYIRPYVACGSFATEFVLSRENRLAEIDEAEFKQIIFKNASIDREMYFKKDTAYEFTKEEDTEFMHFSIDKVAPIIKSNLSKMQKVVEYLKANKRIDSLTINNIYQET